MRCWVRDCRKVDQYEMKSYHPITIQVTPSSRVSHPGCFGVKVNKKIIEISCMLCYYIQACDTDCKKYC